MSKATGRKAPASSAIVPLSSDRSEATDTRALNAESQPTLGLPLFATKLPASSTPKSSSGWRREACQSPAARVVWSTAVVSGRCFKDEDEDKGKEGTFTGANADASAMRAPRKRSKDDEIDIDD
eukprot:97515_1